MVMKKFFPGAVLGVWLLFSGCVKAPGTYETLDDYRREFARRQLPAMLPETEVLTLKKAQDITLINNPTNLAAAQAVYAAKYRYYRALSAYAPEINAGYSLEHTISSGWDLKNPPVGVMKRNNHLVSNGTVQASWLLFDGFARELETIIRKQQFKQSRELEKNVKRLLLRAVAYAYCDMLLAEEEVKINREDLDFQHQALAQSEEQFRNGHVSRAAVLNFRILAARAESRISNAEYRRQTAFHALISLMGLEMEQLPENFKLEKISTENLPLILEEKFYLEAAIKYRPDLKTEKINLNTAYFSYLQAYSGFLPEIRLFSGFALDSYRARYGGYRVSDSHSQQGSFNYGAEGRWNIFRGLNSYNQLRELAMLKNAAKWNLNAKFLEVMTEVRDARDNCRNARRQTALFRDMAQWVTEQRDLVFSEYQNGRETITRLNEAQDILVEARSKLVLYAVEFYKAAAQLAAASGLPEISGTP